MSEQDRTSFFGVALVIACLIGLCTVLYMTCIEPPSKEFRDRAHARGDE